MSDVETLAGQELAPAALALIMAQMLAAVGRRLERLLFADSMGLQLRANNQATGALALGINRETYTKRWHS